MKKYRRFESIMHLASLTKENLKQYSLWFDFAENEWERSQHRKMYYFERRCFLHFDYLKHFFLYLEFWMENTLICSMSWGKKYCDGECIPSCKFLRSRNIKDDEITIIHISPLWIICEFKQFVHFQNTLSISICLLHLFIFLFAVLHNLRIH